MHSNSEKPNIPAEDDLPVSLLEALLMLSSERGLPSGETDAAVMANARQRLIAIRHRRLRHRLLPVLASAACALLALFLFSKRHSTPGQDAVPTEDKYALILREVSAVFPQQIKAIFSNGSDLQITLTDEPLSNSDQAVVIEVCEHGDCTTVITYVGQTLEIRQYRVTVRMDENGGIVIDNPDASSDLHIKTRRI